MVLVRPLIMLHLARSLLSQFTALMASFLCINGTLHRPLYLHPPCDSEPRRPCAAQSHGILELSFFQLVSKKLHLFLARLVPFLVISVL